MEEPKPLDLEIEPQTKQVLRVKLAEFSSRNPINFTAFVVRGARDGPTLALSAAMHGDELAGVECIRRFVLDVDPKRLQGTIVACPILNPMAYAANARFDPIEQLDMNRVFPGNPNGSLTEVFAHFFFENVVRRSDMVIDFHTAAYPDVLLPHVRVRIEARSQEYRNLVDSFGSDVVWFGKPHPGMLQVQADKVGTPVIGVELGAASVVEEAYVREGVEGIENVLTVHGMLSGVAEVPERQLHIAHDQVWQRSPIGGLFIAQARLGDYVRRGQLLGWINDPTGFDAMEVRADVDGFVVGRRTRPLVRSGARLFVILPYDVAAGEERHQHIVKVAQLPHSIHRPNHILEQLHPKPNR